MPIAQYPQIAPPVVTVTATYTGASPQAVEAQVTTPLEQAVNTVQGLRYLSSTSAQGVSSITLTFNLGVNLDIAAADVQNAVQSSLGLLPATVQQLGIQVTKNSGAFVMGIALTSTTKASTRSTMSNYAQINIVNNLTRVPGVSQVIIFGQRQYAMRIWLNPIKLQQQGLDATDVVSALQEQNAEVAAGSIGAPPAPKNQPYTYTVNARHAALRSVAVRQYHPESESERRLRATRRCCSHRVGRAELYDRPALRRQQQGRRAWAFSNIPPPTRLTFRAASLAR